MYSILHLSSSEKTARDLKTVFTSQMCTLKPPKNVLVRAAVYFVMLMIMAITTIKLKVFGF
jgi:hypothetical protein